MPITFNNNIRAWNSSSICDGSDLVRGKGRSLTCKNRINTTITRSGISLDF
jgi:hypothetical protein